MSVNIIENWCDISGTVYNIEPSIELGGFTKVYILVEGVENVDAYPCFFKDSIDNILAVYVPNEIVTGMPLEIDMAIQCRIRKAGLEKFFVHRQHIKTNFPDAKEET